MGRGYTKRGLIVDSPICESEEDEKFWKYMERQRTLAKKYAKFNGQESLDPNLENFIYLEESDE